MKAKITGKIVSMVSMEENGEKWVEIELALIGKIDAQQVSGKEIEGTTTIQLKPVFASEIRFGQILTFDMSTDT
jgi:hypothetical protein